MKLPYPERRVPAFRIWGIEYGIMCGSITHDIIYTFNYRIASHRMNAVNIVL